MPVKWPWSKNIQAPAIPVPGMCGQRGGSYAVHWDWADKDKKENAFFPLLAHVDTGEWQGDDGPTLELRRDYIGPLCPHELAILRGEDSSRSISTSWAFEIREL